MYVTTRLWLLLLLCFLLGGCQREQRRCKSYCKHMTECVLTDELVDDFGLEPSEITNECIDACIEKYYEDADAECRRAFSRYAICLNHRRCKKYCSEDAVSAACWDKIWDWDLWDGYFF